MECAAKVSVTPIEYLVPGNGQTKQGYFWVTHRPGGEVLYRWETSRAAAGLENILPVSFSGTVQCDGYAAYPVFAKERAAIQLAGCWAHGRRKFRDALEQSPVPAAWLLRQIQHLYQIEALLRRHRAGPNLREAVRAAQSRPIVARLKQALLRLKASHRHLPQSLLGQSHRLRLGPMVHLGNLPARPAASRSTTTWSRTPSAPPRWARRTGSSSARLRPASAAPSFTPYPELKAMFESRITARFAAVWGTTPALETNPAPTDVAAIGPALLAQTF